MKLTYTIGDLKLMLANLPDSMVISTSYKPKENGCVCYANPNWYIPAEKIEICEDFRNSGDDLCDLCDHAKECHIEKIKKIFDGFFKGEK